MVLLVLEKNQDGECLAVHSWKVIGDAIEERRKMMDGEIVLELKNGVKP